MLFLLLFIVLIPIVHIYTNLKDREFLFNYQIAKGILNSSNIKVVLFYYEWMWKKKLLNAFFLAFFIWAVTSLTAYAFEDENKYIRELCCIEKIDNVDGELCLKITRVGGILQVKYITTGFIVQRDIPKKYVVFDDKNEVRIYNRTRPYGFERWVLGETTTSLVTIHLNKEISKKF